MIFKSKANKALDRAEDPRETLDYSYEKQLDLLQKVRRGVADVATSRKRLELQIGQLDQQSAKVGVPGEGRAGRRPRGSGPRGADPTQRVDGATERVCMRNWRPCRTRRELTQALTAAAGQGGGPSGPRRRPSGDLLRLRRRRRRSRPSRGSPRNSAMSGWRSSAREDKTQACRPRASAIDELVASGALDDATGTKDSITAELERMASASEVEDTLAAMKAELSGGPGSTAVEAPQRPRWAWSGCRPESPAGLRVNHDRAESWGGAVRDAGRGDGVGLNELDDAAEAAPRMTSSRSRRAEGAARERQAGRRVADDELVGVRGDPACGVHHRKVSCAT